MKKKSDENLSTHANKPLVRKDPLFSTSRILALQESLAPGVKRPESVSSSSPDHFSATGSYPFHQSTSKTEYRSGEFASNECLPSPTSIAPVLPVALLEEAAAASNRPKKILTKKMKKTAMSTNNHLRPRPSPTTERTEDDDDDIDHPNRIVDDDH